jgi:hypothetical protein
MRFEFGSRYFALKHGKVTLVRQPVGPGIAIPWAGESQLDDGATEDVAYDGALGRLHLWIEDLRVRRHGDGREFTIPALPAVHDLDEQEIEVGKAVVELTEQIVVIIRTMPNAELKVLTALPESVAIGGRANEDGEFVFLAHPGMYSVVMGAARHPPINVAPMDMGERHVVLAAE